VRVAPVLCGLARKVDYFFFADFFAAFLGAAFFADFFAAFFAMVQLLPIAPG
jgi:hypothetical protein